MIWCPGNCLTDTPRGVLYKSSWVSQPNQVEKPRWAITVLSVNNQEVCISVTFPVMLMSRDHVLRAIVSQFFTGDSSWKNCPSLRIGDNGRSWWLSVFSYHQIATAASSNTENPVLGDTQAEASRLYTCPASPPVVCLASAYVSQIARHSLLVKFNHLLSGVSASIWSRIPSKIVISYKL